MKLNLNIVNLIDKYLSNNYFQVSEQRENSLKRTYNGILKNNKYTFANLDQITTFISSLIYDKYRYEWFYVYDSFTDFRTINIEKVLKGYNHEFTITSYYSRTSRGINNNHNYYIKKRK